MGQQQLDGMPEIRRISPRIVPPEKVDEIKVEQIRVGGALTVQIPERVEQLDIDDQVVVTVQNADGRTIAQMIGTLSGGGVDRKHSQTMSWLEKTWTVKAY